jgi:hypothetical protein
VVIGNSDFYIDSPLIVEMDKLRSVVNQCGSELLPSKDEVHDLDWLENAEFVSYEGFCNGEFNFRRFIEKRHLIQG